MCGDNGQGNIRQPKDKTATAASFRAERRMRASAVSLATLLLLSAVAFGCGTMNNSNTAQGQGTKFDWDLSQRHTIEQVNWPAENDTNAWALKDVALRLKLSGDKIFAGQMKDVTLARDGKEIASVVLHSPPQTTDAAYAEAKRLAKTWGFDERSLDEWYRTRKAENPENTFATFNAFRNDIEPSLALRLLHSFDDRAPWLVSFEVNWTR